MSGVFGIFKEIENTEVFKFISENIKSYSFEFIISNLNYEVIKDFIVKSKLVFNNSIKYKVESTRSSIYPPINIKSSLDKNNVIIKIDDYVNSIKVDNDFEAKCKVDIDKCSLLVNLYGEKDVTVEVKSFVRLDTFKKYFNGNFQMIESQLFSKDKYNIFVFYTDDIFIYNDYVALVGINDFKTNMYNLGKDFEYKIKKRNRIIALRNSSCHWEDGGKWIIPDYMFFNFNAQNGNCFYEELSNLFKIKLVYMILPFLYDYTSQNNNGLNYSIINGYRKFTVIYNEMDINKTVSEIYLFKQYQWAYSSDNIDKFSILRNITSLFITTEVESEIFSEIITNSKGIYESIKENFNIYIKDNVKAYFDNRQKIRDLINNKFNEVSDQINSLIDIMNKNFIASIGIVFAAGLGYISKNNIIIIKIAAIVYGIYMLITAIFTLPYYNKKVGYIVKDYNENISAFKKILIPKDIPNSNLVESNKRQFKIYLRVSIGIYLVLIVLSVIITFNADFIINILRNILSK